MNERKIEGARIKKERRKREYYERKKESVRRYTI